MVDVVGQQSRIQRLDPAVVNRIAAGEIIQRPASALKELIENSIDAGATNITVIVKDGGLKLLQIQDNGHGVKETDLPLLCERHATSKLTAYDDLQTIATLGFRGEALASISFVSHVAVTTMTRGAPYGLKATYRDGVLQAPGAKPCAAVPGTTIVVEDMFYNVPTRRKVLKNVSEEYGRILDIVGRYAVHRHSCGFTVKRAGEARSDLHTTAQVDALDNVRAVYGTAAAKALQPFEVSLGPDPGQVPLNDMTTEALRVKGYMSKGEYQGRKLTFILFINNRPVDCSPLRRTIEATYAMILPKASKPWIYLDVRLPSHQVDVNLHPTKSEVGFLHTDQVIDAIRKAVEEKLDAADTGRTYVQTLLPGAPPALAFGSNPVGPSATSQRAMGVPEQKLVRTDHRTQTLHAFAVCTAPEGAVPTGVQGPHASARSSAEMKAATVVGTLAAPTAQLSCLQHTETGTPSSKAGDEADPGQRQSNHRSVQHPGRATHVLKQSVPRKRGAASTPGAAAMRAEQQRLARQPQCELASVQELQALIDKDVHADLLEMVRGHFYVGMADLHHLLLQHSTRLYLVVYRPLLQDMMYQLVISRFGRFRTLPLDPPVPVQRLMTQALEAAVQLGTWQGAADNIVEAAQLMRQLLQHKAAMLREYFAITVDENGALAGLPLVLEQYTPDMDRLPEFVLALGRDVEWNQEDTCFHTLAQVVAEFYSAPPLLCDTFQDACEAEEPSDTGTPRIPTSVSDPGEANKVMDALMDDDPTTWGAGMPDGQLTAIAGDTAPPFVSAMAGLMPDAALLGDADVAAMNSVEPMDVEGQTGASVAEAAAQLGAHSGAVARPHGTAAAAAAKPGGSLQEAAAADTVAADAQPPQVAGRSCNTTAAAGVVEGAAEAGEGAAIATAVDDSQAVAEARARYKQWQWTVEHVLMVAMRMFLKPPKARARDGTVVELARTEQLYRVFERC